MSLPTCNPCAEVPLCWEDLEKYSLQDDLYSRVLTCPPNVYCGGPQTMYLACCDGTTMVQNFPLGITIARRNQLIADLVAQCQRRLPFCDTGTGGGGGGGDGEDYFYSAPASCTVYCPDGTPFTYTVPAGVFIASSFAIAQEAARRLACELAPLYRICLGDFNACWCSGTFSRGVISVESQHPPFRVSVIAGALPAGIVATTSGNQVVLSGAATTAGSYDFALQVVDNFGNRTSKAYHITILSITTLALPSYIIGTPYSFQMTAAGGSGNYAWVLAAGTLPDGLAIDINGLISGTPTGLSGGGNVVFEVVDTNCEQATQSLIRPRVSLRGVSNTVIKIFRGWPKWTGYDGTLYKVATFSGDMTQIAFPAGSNTPAENATQCAGAKYTFSGYDEIDEFGRVINTHTRELDAMCNAVTPAVFTLNIVGGVATPVINGAVPVLLGYCWDTDPESCGSCNVDSTTWALVGDRAVFGAYDFGTSMLNLASTTYSAFVKSVSGANFVAGSTNISYQDNFPINDGFGVFASEWPFVQIQSDGAWSVTLSDEFTDADANAGATRYNSNSLIAENKPNYINYLKNTFLNIGSRITTVTYQLNCTNLVIGSNYIARVQLRDSSGAVGTVSIPFTAGARTQVVTGVIPLPAANHTIKAQIPSIVFSPT